MLTLFSCDCILYCSAVCCASASPNLAFLLYWKSRSVICTLHREALPWLHCLFMHNLPDRYQRQCNNTGGRCLFSEVCGTEVWPALCKAENIRMNKKPQWEKPCKMGVLSPGVDRGCRDVTPFCAVVFVRLASVRKQAASLTSFKCFSTFICVSLPNHLCATALWRVLYSVRSVSWAKII